MNSTFEMSEGAPFYPSNNMQMQHQDHAFPKHSQSVKFNMPMPQLVSSRSSNAAIGNMRKLGSINENFGTSTITSVRFADQQVNTDSYFQQQMPQAHNQVPTIQIQHPMHQLRRANTKMTMNFVGHSDQMPVINQRRSTMQTPHVIDES